MALDAICWWIGAALVSRIAASIGISAKVRILCDSVHHFETKDGPFAPQSLVGEGQVRPSFHRTEIFVTPRKRLLDQLLPWNIVVCVIDFVELVFRRCSQKLEHRFDRDLIRKDHVVLA